MKPTRISEASEVVNVWDGEVSWHVKETTSEDTNPLVTLANNETYTSTEKDLERQGYKGFA
jgi:hypothetical protein